MSQIHLDIQTAFEDGEFSFTEIPGSFNGIWNDMATEKTVIKNAKANGGIVGFVKKEASSYSMDTDASYCSTVLSCNEKRSGITSADNSKKKQHQ